jgi:hypothetical protein
MTEGGQCNYYASRSGLSRYDCGWKGAVAAEKSAGPASSERTVSLHFRAVEAPKKTEITY